MFIKIQSNICNNSCVANECYSWLQSTEETKTSQRLTGNERQRKVVPAINAFRSLFSRSTALDTRERENEREEARRTEFHTRWLLQSQSHYNEKDLDHQNDMDFIPHNSSVIHVIEHISFTAAVRINFRLNSDPVYANFTHLTFHLSLNQRSLLLN